MPGYIKTLTVAGKKPVPQQTDAEMMAEFCHNAIQMLVGAVSPQLVWEGAQKQGLTTQDLMKLAAEDRDAVEKLQWL